SAYDTTDHCTAVMMLWRAVLGRLLVFGPTVLCWMVQRFCDRLHLNYLSNAIKSVRMVSDQHEYCERDKSLVHQNLPTPVDSGNRNLLIHPNVWSNRPLTC